MTKLPPRRGTAKPSAAGLAGAAAIALGLLGALVLVADKISAINQAEVASPAATTGSAPKDAERAPPLAVESER